MNSSLLASFVLVYSDIENDIMILTTLKFSVLCLCSGVRNFLLSSIILSMSACSVPSGNLLKMRA